MNKEMIIKQLESMLRTLDFIKEEQAYIKGKLSILLEHNVIETVISWAEDLQQQILNRESAVQLLKNDIVSLDRLVKLQSPQFFSIDHLLMGKLKKFKEQIVYLENNFMQWKHEVDIKLELPSIN
jgi:lipopolysaccharide export system protein LptC